METENIDIDLNEIRNTIPNFFKIDEVRSNIAILEDFCLNLDPYQPLDEASIKKLSELGIEEFDDPFVLTNRLVAKLDLALNELKELENLN